MKKEVMRKKNKGKKVYNRCTSGRLLTLIHNHIYMEFSAKAQAFLELFTIANKMGEHKIAMTDDLAMLAIYQKVDELRAVLEVEFPAMTEGGSPATMAEIVQVMESGS